MSPYYYIAKTWNRIRVVVKLMCVVTQLQEVHICQVYLSSCMCECNNLSL